MPIIIFLILLCGAFTPMAMASHDGHFECVQVVILHAGNREKVETQQYWANVYQRIISSGALRSDEPFLNITEDQANRFGFGYGVMREFQNSYRRFMMGVVYELVLSRLSRTAGLLGGAPAEYSLDAAAAYYLSHMSQFVHGRNPNATERRMEVGGELFSQFPSLQEMHDISDDPSLTPFEIESRISNVLRNGIEEVRATLENGGALARNLESRNRYLQGEPFLVLRNARDHAPTDPVLRVHLVDIADPAIRALHQGVQSTLRLQGTTVLGCTVKVAPATAAGLVKDLRAIEMILGQ